MAGLKQTQFIDNPVSFWTFDSDLEGFNNATIVDEIQNQNPLTVNGINYLLERKSLNDLETTDQASTHICPNSTRELPLGANEDAPKEWLNTFFECPQSTSFDFFNLGQFTIEFMYEKKKEGDFRYDDEVHGQNLHYINHTPVLIKEELFTLKFIQQWNIAGRLELQFVDGRTISIDDSGLNDIYDQINYVNIVHDVKLVDINEYESTILLYLNGRKAASHTQTYFDNYPDTTTRGSFLVGGNGGNDPQYDYCTERLKIDQIAVYNYAFTEEQVSHHYRKSVHYDELIQKDYPDRYWRFDETDPLNDAFYDIGHNTESNDGIYYGDVLRNKPGPEKLVETHSQQFTNGGTAAAISSSNFVSTTNKSIDISSNYTLEFWFRASGSKQGILFSASQRNDPWNGLTIWLNTKDDITSPGNIQVNETKNNYLVSRDIDPTSEERLNWNDDVWHHLMVRRTNNTVELWIDGEIQGDFVAEPVSNGSYSHAYFMGGPPGGFEVPGYMCEVAFYEYAMQDIQIMSRWLFTIRYKIEGYTLLQGVPVAATVRFYDHINGSLLDEVTTDHVSGLYQFYPATQRFVDVVSFIPDNKTTRYRVHGPIKPAEYDDSHLI